MTRKFIYFNVYFFFNQLVQKFVVPTTELFLETWKEILKQSERTKLLKSHCSIPIVTKLNKSNVNLMSRAFGVWGLPRERQGMSCIRCCCVCDSYSQKITLSSPHGMPCTPYWKKHLLSATKYFRKILHHVRLGVKSGNSNVFFIFSFDITISIKFHWFSSSSNKINILVMYMAEYMSVLPF